MVAVFGKVKHGLRQVDLAARLFGDRILYTASLAYGFLSSRRPHNAARDSRELWNFRFVTLARNRNWPVRARTRG
jgi:hypothetical protein